MQNSVCGDTWHQPVSANMGICTIGHSSAAEWPVSCMAREEGSSVMLSWSWKLSFCLVQASKPRALSSVVSIQHDAILPEKRWLCFCVSFGSKVSPYDLFSSSPSLSGLYCSAATYVVKYKVRACPSVVPFVHGCYSGTVQANPWINFPVLLFSASVPHIYWGPLKTGCWLCPLCSSRSILDTYLAV